jgi:hypothetical protein
MFNFLILQWANLIGPSLIKMKLQRLPKIKGCILKYRVPLLWPTYIGETRTTFAKAYGIEVKCYGKHIGNLGNLMGTHWELKGDIVGTHWEPEENEKKSSQKSLSSFLAWPNTPCKEHPTYTGEKGRTLGKTYGIKARCYWEHPWGTHWEPREPIGNLNGTCWEQRKNEKKNQGTLSACWDFPLAAWNFYFQKLLVTILGLG